MSAAKKKQKDNYVSDRRFVFFILKTIAKPIKKKFGVIRKEIQPAPKEPYVLLYNHVTDLDIVWIMDAFYDHMYCIASEHMVRFPVVGKLIVNAFHPIIIRKGNTGTATVMEMHRVLKAGHNVLMAPEGTRTGNGITSPMVPATAAVLKKLKCTIVTARIHGGFFTTPRWGKGIRKGEISVEKINEYSVEDIKNMSVEDLEKHITDDIYEDAYSYNEKAQIAYRGKALAEGIEAQLFMCPCCKKIGTIHSNKNTFFCSCGMKGTLDEYAKISGDNIPFDTITKWDKWQKEELGKLDLSSDDFKVSSDNLSLLEISDNHKTTRVDHGTLTLTNKELMVGNTAIPLTNISGYNMVGFGKLLITTNDKHYYEISNKKLHYPGEMYIKLLTMLKER